MTDLKKMTARELMREDDELPEWWAEIRRRLERLEKCEAALRDYEDCGRQECKDCSCVRAASAALEKCEAAIDKYQAMHNSAWMSGPCQCSACDAARAALEGKDERTTRTT